MTEQFKAATIRALYGSFWLFMAALFATYQALGVVTGDLPPLPEGERWKAAGIAGASAFVANMISRGMAEGWIDSARQANGQVTKADVGQ